MDYNKLNNVIVLGNGSFPKHPVTIKKLEIADFIICCDGAVEKLVHYGKIPDVIVGDMDSTIPGLKKKFANIIVELAEQETNDLTKAVNWCISKGIETISILGATGRREDHTLGNISLLLDYKKNIDVVMYSNTGIFTPILKTSIFKSYPGQQVSIFSLGPGTSITSKNLKYPLKRLKLTSWWMGTLNESTAQTFNLDFKNGKLIVYQEF